MWINWAFHANGPYPKIQNSFDEIIDHALFQCSFAASVWFGNLEIMLCFKGTDPDILGTVSVMNFIIYDGRICVEELASGGSQPASVIPYLIHVSPPGHCLVISSDGAWNAATKRGCRGGVLKSLQGVFIGAKCKWGVVFRLLLLRQRGYMMEFDHYIMRLLFGVISKGLPSCFYGFKLFQLRLIWQLNV
ncbi:uncharacterized protein LOC122076187 isoform X2 [Macadamia integrifolia]|uniref:uncharacterized protein LOC122076187 isoform X2 n=1 Tax=Macadamia integrifolia TaxID=60698 RepID=UPI001C4F0D5B|nr:uncharacterized protein LOC122076187 isoform X2 [Macadamia integrifolia]